MDAIYPPSQFISTPNIQIKNHFKEYSKICNLEATWNIQTNLKTEDEAIFHMMGLKLTEAEKQVVSGNCSVSRLTVDGETTPQPRNLNKPTTGSLKFESPYKITSEAKKLATVQTRLRHESDKNFLKLYRNKLRRDYNHVIVQQEPSKSENDLKPGVEILISVRVYHPFLFSFQQNNKSSKFKFSHEIEVLGSQTLACLRDKILCSHDMGLKTEVEDPTEVISFNTAKEKYPSGFIFVDNVFYNDWRHENALDYSLVIRKWAQQKGIGELKTAVMEDTRMDDLSPKLGYPYVYQHQADCEHVICFTDVRLLNTKDSLSPEDYPQYSSLGQVAIKHCNMCGLSASRWLCIDNQRLPHVITYLCQDCFISYNYIDGQKVGTFKAYSYFDNNAIIPS